MDSTHFSASRHVHLEIARSANRPRIRYTSLSIERRGTRRRVRHSFGEYRVFRFISSRRPASSVRSDELRRALSALRNARQRGRSRVHCFRARRSGALRSEVLRRSRIVETPCRLHLVGTCGSCRKDPGETEQPLPYVSHTILISAHRRNGSQCHRLRQRRRRARRAHVVVARPLTRSTRSVSGAPGRGRQRSRKPRRDVRNVGSVLRCVAASAREYRRRSTSPGTSPNGGGSELPSNASLQTHPVPDGGAPPTTTNEPPAPPVTKSIACATPRRRRRRLRSERRLRPRLRERFRPVHGPVRDRPADRTDDAVLGIPLFSGRGRCIRPTDDTFFYSYLGADQNGMGVITPLSSCSLPPRGSRPRSSPGR